MKPTKPALISFKLCPFVQRSVIALLEKGIDFDITYIDLKEPPEWFLAISPFGKVPVLRIGETILFESAVINEYLDEVNPPSLHPSEPLQRAHNRMWIEFGSSLNFDLHGIMALKEIEQWTQKCDETKQAFGRVEEQLTEGPYFNGSSFSLADAAYAPPLMRAKLLDDAFGLNLLADVPRVTAWTKVLSERETVQRSVVPEFTELFFDYIHTEQGHLSSFR